MMTFAFLGTRVFKHPAWFTWQCFLYLPSHPPERHPSTISDFKSEYQPRTMQRHPHCSVHPPFLPHHSEILAPPRVASLQGLSVRGARPLLPVCMMDSVNRFAPSGHRPVLGGRPSMAQSLAASNVAAYAMPEQEDAQEYLSFLLVHLHEVRVLGIATGAGSTAVVLVRLEPCLVGLMWSVWGVAREMKIR